MILTNPTLLGLSFQYLSAEKYQSLNFINVDYVKHTVNQTAENHRKYQCFSKMQEKCVIKAVVDTCCVCPGFTRE